MGVHFAAVRLRRALTHAVALRALQLRVAEQPCARVFEVALRQPPLAPVPRAAAATRPFARSGPIRLSGATGYIIYEWPCRPYEGLLSFDGVCPKLTGLLARGTAL